MLLLLEFLCLMSSIPTVAYEELLEDHKLEGDFLFFSHLLCI